VGATSEGSSSQKSASSPVAIRMTLTDMPITSAGRLSPRGPLGMAHLRGKEADVSFDYVDLVSQLGNQFIRDIAPFTARQALAETSARLFIPLETFSQALLRGTCVLHEGDRLDRLADPDFRAGWARSGLSPRSSPKSSDESGAALAQAAAS
jgi:hypothetical protein